MKKNYNRRHYFRKQQLLGVGILILGVLSSIVLDGDITVALFTTPIGLYMALTRKMLLQNDYYYAVKHCEKMRNRRP